MRTSRARSVRTYSVPVDGPELRHEMRLRGLTGAELARRARVSAATISHALNGRRIHPAKRRAIYAALHSVEPMTSQVVGSPADVTDGMRGAQAIRRLRSGYVCADPSLFARLARGYSYREIAGEAGISTTTVSRIAAGLPVRPSVLRRAAVALTRLQADPSIGALLAADGSESAVVPSTAPLAPSSP